MRTTIKNVFLRGEEVKVRQFSAGEVAELLGLPPWRIQKFLNSPQFKLASIGQMIGEGRGSRRAFRENDLYLIGLAGRLTKDGFAADLVGKIIENLDRENLVDLD